MTRSDPALRPPLMVWIAWHHAKGSNADSFAAMLQARLSSFYRPESDPGSWRVPGMVGVAVRLLPWGGEGKGPRAYPRLNEARQHVIVVYINHWMFRHRKAWGDWVEKVQSDIGPKRTMNAQLVPVAACGNAEMLCPTVQGLNVVQVRDGDQERLFSDLLLICLRTLDDSPGAGSPVRVFLSHTKRGGGAPVTGAHASISGGEPHARLLRTYLLENTQAQVFFDRSELPHARPVLSTIVEAIRTTAFLAVLTDAYFEREWCLLETRLAIEEQRPLVVVDALGSGLTRNAPFFGFAPMVPWSAGVPIIVSTLLLEILRIEVLKRRRELLDLPQLRLVVSPPTSLEIAAPEKEVVYPDPPLPRSTIEALMGVPVERKGGGRPRPHWRTLTEHLVRRDLVALDIIDQPLGPVSGEARFTVGLSISRDDSLGAHQAHATGLVQRHIDDLLCEVGRMVVLLDGRLALGTDLDPRGATLQLLDVLHQYVGPDRLLHDHLVSFLAWPVHWRLGERTLERRLDQADVELLDGPEGCPTEEMKMARATAAFEARGPELARAFTDMRKRMTEQCDARVVFGGALRGYLGSLPGTVEEVALALEAGQPVYLLGGLGGAARAIFNSLGQASMAARLGESWQCRYNKGYRALLETLHGKKSYTAGLDRIQVIFRGTPIELLAERNGLSVDENKLLAATLNPLEIVRLIARGLGTVAMRRRAAPA